MSSNDTRLEAILTEVLATLQAPIRATKYDKDGNLIEAQRVRPPDKPEKTPNTPTTTPAERAAEAFKEARAQLPPERFAELVLTALYAHDDRITSRVAKLERRLERIEALEAPQKVRTFGRTP